jgi:hypothetical protein
MSTTTKTFVLCSSENTTNPYVNYKGDKPKVNSVLNLKFDNKPFISEKTGDTWVKFIGSYEGGTVWKNCLQSEVTTVFEDEYGKWIKCTVIPEGPSEEAKVVPFTV